MTSSYKKFEAAPSEDRGEGKKAIPEYFL